MPALACPVSCLPAVSDLYGDVRVSCGTRFCFEGCKRESGELEALEIRCACCTHFLLEVKTRDGDHRLKR